MKKKLIYKIMGFIVTPIFLFAFAIFVLTLSVMREFEEAAGAVYGKDKSKNDEHWVTVEINKKDKEEKAGSINSNAGIFNILIKDFEGVDDTDTELSRRVLSVLSKWSNKHNPYYNGYKGLCEMFCNHVYRDAGYDYGGYCCACNHRNQKAHKKGKIPKGALLFSGQKKDGTMYNNGAQYTCPNCGNAAGHIGIYIGNGKVVGSNDPYEWTLDQWFTIVGYGGWSYD